MKYGSEVLSIIEAGFEHNEKKLRAYCNLLIKKLPDDDYMKDAIKHVLDESYVDQQQLKAINLAK